MTWFLFIVVAAVIIFAGSKLSSLAEKLAEQFHISSSTVGLLLVSIVTSLPELSTSLGAVLKVGEPNLAVGNTLGSDLFNLMIIALCDLLFRKKGLLRQSNSPLRPLIYYLIMISAVLLTLTLPNSIHLLGLNFNIGSLFIIALYLFLFFRTHQGEQAERKGKEIHAGARKTALLFAFFSAMIIVAGTMLAKLGDQIADQTGLEQSFVGTLFLALATSLPELTVSISAVRIGAYDLMVGNIIGSNMFNVFICAISDIAYRREAFHIPGNLNPGLLFIGGCVILMALCTAAGMRQKHKAKRVAWESILVLVLYLTGLFALHG
jgi:cation:H+ antiporter